MFVFVDTLSDIPLAEPAPYYFRLCSELGTDLGISVGIFSRGQQRGLGGQISAKLICDEAFTLIMGSMAKGLFGFELLRETVKGVNSRVLELGYKLTAKGKMQGDLLVILCARDGSKKGLLIEAAKVGTCGGVVVRGRNAFSLFSPQIAKDYVRLGAGDIVPAELVSVTLSGKDVAIIGSRVSPTADKWELGPGAVLKPKMDGELLMISP